MIVHNGVLADITSQIAQGRGTSALWTGNGITSSSAAATPTLTALGVELNDDGTGTNTPLMTTFDGETVGDTDVLVKYTFVGDANLSGTITSADYLQIDNGFNSQTGTTPLTGWANGDFNYDGLINGDDYTLIDNAFNSQGSTTYAATSAGPAEMIAIDTAQITSPAAVPEPSVVLIGFTGITFSRRRISRRR